MTTSYSLAGQVFGKLTVLAEAARGDGGRQRWQCRYDCGHECMRRTSELLRQPPHPCRRCIANEKARATAIPIADRFWSKVNKDGPVPPHRPELGPCWVWTASRAPNGYGHMGLGDGTRQTVDAHVASFFLAHDRWPDNLVLHRCDNRPCVRPDHLFEGTHQDNRDDCEAKGRHNFGVRNGSAKLTDESVREIRQATGSQESVAARFGVSQMTVCDVKRGRYWSHVK